MAAKQLSKERPGLSGRLVDSTSFFFILISYRYHPPPQFFTFLPTIISLGFSSHPPLGKKKYVSHILRDFDITLG